MYVREGSRFNAPHRRDRSGLHLLRRDHRTVVKFVDDDSAAAKAGINEGDAIVGIDDREASDLSLDEIRNILCREGAAIRLKSERDGRQFETILRLSDGETE